MLYCHVPREMRMCNVMHCNGCMDIAWASLSKKIGARNSNIRMGSVRLVSFSFSRNWIFGVSFRGSLRFGSWLDIK